MPVQRRALVVIGIKWLLAAALTHAYLWSVRVAVVFPPGRAGLWPAVQILAVLSLLLGLLEQEVWAWLAARLPGRLSLTPERLRLAAQPALGLALTLALAAVLPAWLPGYGGGVVGLGALNLLLLLLGLALRRRDWAALGRLAISLFSFAVTVLLIEWLVAPAAYRILSAPDTAGANPDDAPAFDAGALWSGVMHTEVVGVAGPGPEWGPLAGWGTNTDTTIHAWMDGVFDVMVEYNRQGFRGPEIAYEKPDDVYRILIVGDSLVEALQVEYADTLYAQLGDMLADARTPDGRRVEVFGVGATGWGTLQAFLYYHYEGARFAPDLVVHVFFINDVVDNHPDFFYGDLRKLDFIIEGDGVRAYDPTKEETPARLQNQAPPEPTTPAKRWLDALPDALQGSSIVGLLRLWVDPPRLIAGIEGNLRGTHPQNFIYVSEPEIEGYAEAWYRTRRACEIWHKDVQANGAALMVVAVDISPEMVELISNFYPEETEGWVWDADLPFTRLAQILDPLGVPLILTRDAYQAYADSIGQAMYPAIFIPEDGHWSVAGHCVTAELIAGALRERGIVR